MQIRAFATCLTALLSLCVLVPSVAKEPLFLLHQIGTDHSEGIAAFDFDRDGKLDVTSGAYWYKAPDWSRQEFREARLSGELVQNCNEYAIDVNRDGQLDIISAPWGAGGINYFENPRQLGVIWPKKKVADTKDLEGMLLVDVDGDGEADILPTMWSDQAVWWLQIKDGAFKVRPVGPAGNGHGVGFGDIDGDGKSDIVTPRGWYRQLDVSADNWEWNPSFELDETGIPIVVFDVNNDGLADFIYGQGHSYGLFWMEQKLSGGKRTFERHVIDDSYSQIHVLKLADINADGKLELLAGKRYRGHNERDDGSFDPLAIYYYTIEPGKDPKFTRVPLAYNALAGGGTQFVVVDLDGDGDLDVLCAGKTGQYWFENLTVNKVPWQQRDILFNRYPSRP